MEDDALIREIESAHLSANNALKKKDFASYAQHFSNDLKYRQLNGRTIDKKALMNDVALYFDRVVRSSSEYKRTSLQITDNRVTERLIQKSTVALRALVFFSKEWTVEREGIYEWKKDNGIWQIASVEILSEKVY